MIHPLVKSASTTPFQIGGEEELYDSKVANAQNNIDGAESQDLLVLEKLGINSRKKVLAVLNSRRHIHRD
jgi:hypothetical protein|tara:strand:- start:268 stop:477 length:210 start_codon:yes stop_codon:yes gene_type:complete